MTFLKRYPFHPLLIAAYPVLALLAHNLGEVSIDAGLRSLLVFVAGGALIFGLARLIFRSWQRAAQVTTLVLIVFFSYGHVYQLLHATTALGRHRFLIPVFGLLFAAGLWLILRIKDNRALTLPLNAFSLFLIVFPLVQIGIYQVNASHDEQAARENLLPAQPLQPADPQALPDVYYIVLDTYTRADALMADFDFDNGPFIDQLSQMGFYVADCSRPNYNFTMGSLAATLNLDYLGNVFAQFSALNPYSNVWTVIKQSVVRQQLEQIGYRTVAFDSGYEWTRFKDADVYLAIDRASYDMQSLTPFESMLANTTALLILRDSQIKAVRDRYNLIDFPYQDHINLQRFILAELPVVSKDPRPTFVFVHLLVPHIPYVFAPDGSIRTDPGFYSGEQSEPINDTYRREGYTGEIAFINDQILAVTSQILANSNVPPIIVIHGDHGLNDQNRFEIFNAYYLPGDGADDLYPTITPVNSFRVIFNHYFATAYPLLPDITYADGAGTETVPERSPACITN